MKYVFALLLALTMSYNADAQNIILRDGAGNIVNGDTLDVSPGGAQKPPYIDMYCKLYTQNNTGNSINLRAKKAEITPDADAMHSICFEQHCYPPTTYITPTTVPLLPMSIDSTFKGSYIYTDGQHTPGKYLVVYTLFNNDNPTDSALVYVRYNDNTTGIAGNMNIANSIRLYPNPASDVVYITSANKLNGTLSVTNSIGTVAYKQMLNDLEIIPVATGSWPAGMYYYNLESKGGYISGSFIKE